MRVQKRASYILAAPLFIIATVVMQFSGVGIGNASAASLVWDGSAGDNLFSNGENWNTGNAPVDGDVLSFSTTGLVAPVTYTNDIDGLSIAGINVSGTPGSYVTSVIDGNPLTLTGNISNTSAFSGSGTTLSINSGVVLGANVTATGPIEFGGSGKTTNLGAYDFTMTNPASNCAASAGALAGSGSVTFSGGADTKYSLSSASTGFTGTVTINSGLLYVTSPANLGSASLLTVNGSGDLSLYSTADSTWTTPLSLGGSGSIAAQHSSNSGCSGGAPSEKYTATVTAPVVLTSNFKYSGADNLTLTGTYTDNGHSFVVASGAAGALVTPSGEVVAPVTEIALDGEQPSTFVNVGFNEIATLNGTRGSISVTDGGVLKGTGIAQSLSSSNRGIVAPGNSPGTLTVLDSYNQDDAILRAEILNTTSYDKLAVGASYSGGGSAVSLGLNADLETVLYDGWNINAGDKFTIIDNVSATAVQGTFNGLAEGAQFTVDGVTFTISYVGGDGNDVVLTALNGGVDVPNTGVEQFIKGNPVLVAGLGILAATTILFAATRRKSNQ